MPEFLSFWNWCGWFLIIILVCTTIAAILSSERRIKFENNYYFLYRITSDISITVYIKAISLDEAIQKCQFNEIVMTHPSFTCERISLEAFYKDLPARSWIQNYKE